MKQFYKHIAFEIAEVIHDPILNGTAPGWIEEFGTGEISLADLAKNLNCLGFPQDAYVLGKIENIAELGLSFGFNYGFEMLNPYKVLIVEDNLLLAHARKTEIGKIKLRFGLAQNDETRLKIDLAATAAEAQEKHRKNSYDLIFMDLIMPGPDGATATQEINSQDQYPETRVYLTANFLPEQVSQLIQDCGAVAYIQITQVEPSYFAEIVWAEMQKSEKPVDPQLVESLFLSITERMNKLSPAGISIVKVIIDPQAEGDERGSAYLESVKKAGIKTALKSLPNLEETLRGLLIVLEHYIQNPEAGMASLILETIRSVVSEGSSHLLDRLGVEVKDLGVRRAVERIVKNPSKTEGKNVSSSPAEDLQSLRFELSLVSSKVNSLDSKYHPIVQMAIACEAELEGAADILEYAHSEETRKMAISGLKSDKSPAALQALAVILEHYALTLNQSMIYFTLSVMRSFPREVYLNTLTELALETRVPGFNQKIIDLWPEIDLNKAGQVTRIVSRYFKDPDFIAELRNDWFKISEPTAELKTVGGIEALDGLLEVLDQTNFWQDYPNRDKLVTWMDSIVREVALRVPFDKLRNYIDTLDPTRFLSIRDGLEEILRKGELSQFRGQL